MNSESLDRLIALDAAGFLITPGEDAAGFLKRVEAVREVSAAFEKELASGEKIKVFDIFEVSADCRIPPEITGEVAGITEKLYGFAVHHVPGFFLKKKIGWLWGGCLVGDPEANFAVFLLRDVFRKKRRFLNYCREELLAHELCHAVRHVMEEPALEEYFAYQTSDSPLRRYLGNCFISDKDALGFLLPVMLLPAAELVKALFLPWFPAWIFWILAVIYPLFLLCRNHFSRKLVIHAAENLRKAGVSRAEAVLFRCTLEEVGQFSTAKAEDIPGIIEEKSAGSLRWQVISARFCQPAEPAGVEGVENL